MRRQGSRGLTCYLHDERTAFRFQLAGDLDRDSAADLEQSRQTAWSMLDGRRLVVDVTGIESIDAAGRELFDRWRGLGAEFVVTSGAKPRVTTHKVLLPDITGW
jgi:anti-anti-sigma regulatory factor